MSKTAYSVARAFILFSVLCVFCAWASPCYTEAGIQWEPFFKGAMERADTGNMPVFIAINMDGEPVCEEIAENHYRDRRIVKLSEHLVCLFASRYYHDSGDEACPRAGEIPCAYHQQVEKELRKAIPEIEDGNGDVIAPSHVFLGPDGKVLFSVPYIITPGELEWCMKEAVCKVNPSFKWKLGSGAHAPRRIRYGEVVSPGGEDAGGGGRGGDRGKEILPLSGKELEEAIEQINKSGRRDRGESLREYLPALIRTDEKKAIDLVRIWMNNRWVLRGDRASKMIRDIGRVSPLSWWEVVAEFVSHDRIEIRNEAIVALEQFGEPKSLKHLMKQRSSEKEESAKANLVRAIASVGRANRSSCSLVLKTAEKDRSERLRISALIGLTYIEDREKVNSALAKALLDEAPGIRAAAAYTIAVRRERELAEALDVAIDVEADPDVKGYLDAAKKALDGGGLEYLEGVLKEYARDTIPRDRK